MPTANVTKYCCKYLDKLYGFANHGAVCSNTYTVENFTVTSSSNFGTWTDNKILSTACYSIDLCQESPTNILRVKYTIGCIPTSLYPLDIDFDVYENGVFWRHAGALDGELEAIDCPSGTCPEICS